MDRRVARRYARTRVALIKSNVPVLDGCGVAEQSQGVNDNPNAMPRIRSKVILVFILNGLAAGKDDSCFRNVLTIFGPVRGHS